MRLEVLLGEVVFLARPRDGSEPFGLFIEREGLQGWDDGVTVRGESVPIPAGHGEFDLPVFRGGRAITLSGVAAARSPFELGRLRSLVMGIGAAGQSVPIRVWHQDEWLRAVGRIAPGTTPAFRDTGGAGPKARARFELQLLCRDPRKYGASRMFAAGALAFHRGNFPAIPAVRVTRRSGSGGYTVSTPAGRVVVSQALPVGASHLIDLRTGGLYNGATRIVGGMPTFQPWTIPAASTGLVHTVSTGLTLEVEVTDTYI